MGFFVNCIKWIAAILIITLTWIPIIFWRALISLLFGNIVPVNDSMFASISSHPKANMSIILTTKLAPASSINLSALRDKFISILQKPKYQRLTQKIEQRFGFSFFVNDPYFDICFHIQKVEEKSLIEFKKKLMSVPFSSGSSPWSVFLIKGEKEDVIIFKFHHALLDGHSLKELLEVEVCDDGHKNKKTKKYEGVTTFVKQLFFTPLAIFGAIHEFVKVLDWVPEVNDLHCKIEDELGGNNNPVLIQIVGDVSDVKSKAKKGGVPYFVIVLEAITSATRTLFGNVDKIPESISCYSPLPHPKRPDELGNHWWGLTIPLPVGEKLESKRITFLMSYLKKNVNGWKICSTLCLQNIFGHLSNFQLGQLTNVKHFTLSISDFAGPQNKLRAFGSTLEDIDYFVGLPHGNIGIAWHGLSYCGKWNMNLIVDRKLVKDPDIASQKYAESFKKCFQKSL